MQLKPRYERVLLVEDNDIDVMWFERIVKRHKFNVSIVRARNGEEALEILQFPDEVGLAQTGVILLDLNMPKMDGYELLEHIATNGPEVEMPIYILTTSDSETDKEKLRSYTIAGYLVKPLTNEILNGVLNLSDAA